MIRRVALLLSTAAVATALAGCTSGGGGGSYKLTAYFDKAISLYDQSSVRVLGLPAGKVTDVEVEGTQVRVEMSIDRDVPVPADVQATIVPLSLIGERYIQLFPAWVDGQSRAEDGAVIPRERTTIPVEPDEALAAVKEFLDALDPDATGRLIKNLAGDLEGNGQHLNDALRGLGTLTQTFADKDEEIGRIIDQFDDFTATLAVRDRQLARVMQGFAATTGVLAQERKEIESLVAGLAELSTDGLDLVTEHGGRLEGDIEVLARTLKSVQSNIAGVRQLLDGGPLLVAGPNLDGKAGLAGAYDAKYHHLDLRTSVSPTLDQFIRALGIVPALTVCLPVDVDCVATPAAVGAGSKSPASAAPAVAGKPAVGPRAEGEPSLTTTPAPRPPIDEHPGVIRARAAHDRPARGGWWRTIARAAAGVVT